MDIILRNEIVVEHEIEVVHHTYSVDVTEKNGQLYLIYVNEDQEKVMIRLAEKDLLMTRYSSPKSTMLFTQEGEGYANIPTPLGVQRLRTVTDHYQVDLENQTVSLHYGLYPQEGDQTLAMYRMHISWK